MVFVNHVSMVVASVKCFWHKVSIMGYILRIELTPLAMVYAILLFTIVLGNMTHVHFINFNLTWHGPDSVAPSDHLTH